MSAYGVAPCRTCLPVLVSRTFGHSFRDGGVVAGRNQSDLSTHTYA